MVVTVDNNTIEKQAKAQTRKKRKQPDIREQGDNPSRHVNVRTERYYDLEPRRLQFVGGKGKFIRQQHFFNISVPKSFARRFNLGKGDMFMWSVAKESPLTFLLQQVNYTSEEGNN